MKSNKIAVVLISLVLVISVAANAQTQVFVPGNTNGGFGNPIDQTVSYVPAVAVTGPATITVTYVSGTVSGPDGVNAGPDGVTVGGTGGQYQTPLQEAKGVGKTNRLTNLDALIGVFVPADRVNYSGFTAVDGTKNLALLGIKPSGLILIGTGKTWNVTEAGTLYLGINDCLVNGNGGGFNVDVSAQ